ncbi:AraC family transcriptional regulator [Cognatishimia maritima]|uniref:AraC-type DNA-binding protein n=1 Tax=Cognatishimia maritima TaxID=870908 RepID=A0A1M5L4Y9_9RHOB|nr:AraC family transcriptional regulator [Cognatishimia maritima]SHG59483.1 AraC-type DNA-binding protein [Cognatishimia maritima]
MTLPPAYAFVKDFDPEPSKTLVMDRHYLLYAAKGAMRLEAEGRGWTLPPARAALIHAGREITVAMPQRLSACSVLFDTGFVAAPKASLSVFEMTPLARELVLACRTYGPDATLDDYGMQLFQLLAVTTWKLAETPSRAGLPSGKSDAVRKALALTETQLAGEPSFEMIATQVALSPRTLARRFSEELGMTWRQALRRLRMNHAIEALADPQRQITEIAFSVGYNSLSAFNTAFRDFTGLTPTEFRGSFGG